MQNKWRNIKRYEAVLAIAFITSIALFIANDFIGYKVPKEFLGYFFWLSLGLWLGFQLYKQEHKRLYKEEQKQSNKNSN